MVGGLRALYFHDHRDLGMGGAGDGVVASAGFPRGREVRRPHPVLGAAFCVVVRRRPTLPHSLGCSTIGAGGLSFRVRNGSGRFPTAMAAVTLFNCHTLVLGGVCLLVVSCTVDAVGFVAWWCCGQVLGLLVPVG